MLINALCEAEKMEYKETQILFTKVKYILYLFHFSKYVMHINSTSKNKMYWRSDLSLGCTNQYLFIRNSE